VRLGLEPIPEGILRVAETPEAISKLVIDLLRDPAAAAGLGQRGREWARSIFRWEKALEAFESDGALADPTPATGRLAAAGG